MRNFRLLKADEIECRISQVSDNGVTVLLYKTARTDYALLDEKFGLFGWQNDYRVIDGKMYCGIGIKNGDEWIWKWNCGTESNTEAEKGQASDAMKRAGFAWGIGTELYSAPYIFIGNEYLRKRQDKKVYDKFYVKEIEYTDTEDICTLAIINHKKEVVYTFGKTSVKINAQAVQEAPKTKDSTPPKVSYPAKQNANTGASDGIVCDSCGKPISEKVEAFSVKKFGRPLCMDCQRENAR